MILLKIFYFKLYLIVVATTLAGCIRKPSVNISDTYERPNVVLILADDMGWSDLGCYGGEIPTPNIDALASQGLRFTQFYNNAVCGPSRASLLTGLYVQRVGHSGRHWNQPTDFSKSITIGEALQQAGYYTMMVGKWQEPDLPAKRGFNRFFGHMCSGKISYYDEVLHNPFYLDEERVKLPADFYLTDALTDHAVQFLNEAAANKDLNKKPFFLYVAHIAPHWPLHARETDVAPHRKRYLEKGWDEWREQRIAYQRQNGLIPGEWETANFPDTIHPWAEDQFKEWQAERMAVYAAQVASIDRSTGQILEALEKTGKLKNTLVIVMSDNGAAPNGGLYPTKSGFFTPSEPPEKWRLNGEGVREGSGPDNLPGPPNTFAAYGIAWALTSNTPLRNTKATGYEGGIRTPLIVYWPEFIRSKSNIVNDAGHVIDIMPTLLEVAGGTYPTEFKGRRPIPLDGRSLLPVFRGETLPDRDYLAWRVPNHRVLRSGDWKIISADENSPWELYDMSSDGTETQNIADRHPEIVKQFSAKWEEWSESCKSGR